MKAALALIGFVVAAYAAAAVGALFTPGAWYEGLAKPSWNPPNWIFGPVWTALYATIAVSGWLVWRDGAFRPGSTAFNFYALQLLLNALWSWIFFGLQRPGWAMLEIVLLWLAIGATVLAFWRVRPLAGLLLLPYLAWVTFASALNLALWRLNS